MKAATTKRKEPESMGPRDSASCPGQTGNALIYVLIAIALFAALTFALGRGEGTSETGTLSAEKAQMYATQIVGYSAQVKSSVEQMLFTGTAPETIDFLRPGDAGFDTAPHIHKIYHPDGGGLSLGTIPKEARTSAIASPPAGWYLGRFNTVGWTKTASPDILLTSFQIDKTVCEKINESITGTSAIPQLTGAIRDYLIDDSLHGGSNADFTSAVCAACEGLPSLCVQDNSGSAYAYYSLIVDR